MPIQWRDPFSVCNDMIDADHQYLLEIINKAEASLKANPLAKLPVLLGELAHDGQLHFQREEQLARAIGYPQSD